MKTYEEITHQIEHFRTTCARAGSTENNVWIAALEWVIKTSTQDKEAFEAIAEEAYAPSTTAIELHLRHLLRTLLRWTPAEPRTSELRAELRELRERREIEHARLMGEAQESEEEGQPPSGRESGPDPDP